MGVNTMAPKIAAVDLFCGVGGLTYGLIKAGIPVKAGIDMDVSCRYAYERNNGALFIHKNIKELDGMELKQLYPETTIKILVGCAPCQPFSQHTHKNRQRGEDEEWGLLYHFSRLIKQTEPTIISMENVPQIVKHKVFHDFTECLQSLGYHVFWKSVFCPDYGIPQKRTRLVLLASKLGDIEILPPTHKPSQYRTVKDAIGKLKPIKAGQVSKNDILHRSSVLEPINLERIKNSRPGGSWRDWDKDLRAKCHRRRTGKSYSAVYARMRWDKPSPTITTQFNSFGTGRFGHPTQNRAISLREGALLQTFPKKYKFLDSKSPFTIKKIGAHIGNAVPVRLGVIIGRSIKMHLERYGK
jgi:DNA (cytosine-5)-methyltransferase 1